MQIWRKIIGAVFLISVVFFVVMSLVGSASSTVRITAIGAIFIGGVIWFLMQMEDSRKPKEEKQKPNKDNPPKPSAKENELIQYIRSNILISNTCSTSRYNNRNINLEGLVQNISDFYDRNFKWSKPTRIEFDNIISLINDESIIVLIKGINNIVVKVHVPVDTSEVKTELVGAAPSVLRNMAWNELNAGGGFGRINPGMALRKALGDRDTAVDALKQQRRRLEESIAKYIDDLIRNNQSSQKSEQVDMIYLRNLKNWRT